MRSKEKREAEKSEARNASANKKAAAPQPKHTSKVGVFCFAAAIFVLFSLIGTVLVSLAVGLSAWACIAGACFGAVGCYSIRIANQWERVVILRLGKYNRQAGPGLYFIIPIIEFAAAHVDQRIITTPSYCDRTVHEGAFMKIPFEGGIAADQENAGPSMHDANRLSESAECNPVPRGWIPLLCFGLVFSAYIVAIGRIGSSDNVFDGMGVFFAACSAGMVVTGLVAILLGNSLGALSVGRLRALLCGLAIMALVCCVTSVVVRSFVVEAAFHPLVIGVMGLMFGFGCLVLVLVWTILYAEFPFMDTLRVGSLSLVLAVMLAAVGQWLPQGLASALYVSTLLAISSIAAVLALQSASLVSFAPEDNTSESQSKLFAILRSSWAPLCGLSICAYLLGLLWTQQAPSQSQPSFALVQNLGFAGPLFVAVGMAYAAFRVNSYVEVKRFFWVVIPVVAALFVVTPLFESVQTDGWNTIVVNLQNGGSVALIICTWPLLMAATRAKGCSIVATFGGGLALVAGMSVIGLLTHCIVGSSGNVVAVVMFVSYVCATVVFLALKGTGDRQVHEQEHCIIESFMRPRCSKVAQHFGLTPRESEILLLLSRGHCYSYIAENAYISEATVRTHARNIYRKVGVASQEELLNFIDTL